MPNLFGKTITVCNVFEKNFLSPNMQTYISEVMSFIEIKSRYFSFVNYYLVDESLDLEKLQDRKILSAFSKRFLSYQKEIQQCDK